MSKYPNKNSTKNQENKIKDLLSSLEVALAKSNLLSAPEKDLLHCTLLAKLGEYRKAHKYALGIERNKLSGLVKPLSKHHLLLMCARLSHEISRYESCQAYSVRILDELKTRSEYDINVEVQARCLVSESLRMRIPGDLYFTRRKRLSDYLYIFFVAGHFIFASIINNLKLRFGKLSYFELRAEAQHELIEHRIRFYALIQSVFGSPQRGWNKYVKIFLIRRWDNTKMISHRVGYSAGIANSGKFKYRLDPSEKTKDESANIYSLTTSATGSELLIRNEADQLLRDNKCDECRKKYIMYTGMAKKSGNTLNEIKGIIGYAYSNYIEGKSPLLSESLKKRYSILVELVEGRRWKEYFAYIDRIIFNGTRST